MKRPCPCCGWQDRWLLEAGNNITMEPYRTYVADRLRPQQQSAGFLTQSAFTGFAQCASYAALNLLALGGVSIALSEGNSIPDIVTIAFLIGAVLSITTIAYSVVRVPEIILPEEERRALVAKSRSRGAILAEIGSALASSTLLANGPHAPS